MSSRGCELADRDRPLLCRGCGKAPGDAHLTRTGRARGRSREYHCSCGHTGWSVSRAARRLPLLSTVGCPCRECQAEFLEELEAPKEQSEPTPTPPVTRRRGYRPG